MRARVRVKLRVRGARRAWRRVVDGPRLLERLCALTRGPGEPLILAARRLVGLGAGVRVGLGVGVRVGVEGGLGGRGAGAGVGEG